MARDDYKDGKRVMHADAKAMIVVKLEQSLLHGAGKIYVSFYLCKYNV
jgi:hypothetical protein